MPNHKSLDKRTDVFASLNPAQKSAVEYLSGPSIVLAGPGTGKTQLISSKVAYILENTDASPENILCLTYSEAGATNMRNRLLSIIGPAAIKVQIHTYHAFGSCLLAEYKNYAENFDRNLDAAIDPIISYKIIKSIQDSLPTFDILKNAKTSDIIDTISSAKSAQLSSKDLKKIAETNILDTEKLNPKLNDVLQNLQSLKHVNNKQKFEVGVSEVYLPLMEVLKDYVDTQPICGNIEREANSLLQELNSLIETERAKEKPSISPLTSWKNKRFEKDDQDNYRLSNRVANKKLLSLAHIMQQYETYLEDSGLYDFDDMIHQALKILKTDQGFKLTLEERYQYILLDEFQDTNAAQAELVYRLTDYDQPNVMAVGDDDQAIFAFQGANVSNLIDYKKHYHAKDFTLLKNYRSYSEILNTSYKIREQIQDSFAKEQGIDKKLSAFKTGSAEISRHEFLEPSAEYHWIAEQVKELISSGVKQSDIAIITPQHKYVTPLLPYLKDDATINVAYEKRDNLFEHPRIAEILTLSRFIYELSLGKNPAHLLLEILSFPFLEISPLEAVRTINRVPKKFSLDYLLESENEAIKDFGNFIAELTVKSTTVSLEQFLDYLVGITPYSDNKRSKFLEFYTKSQADYSTFELYENLNILREAVLKHRSGQSTSATKNSTSKISLKDLIEFVDDYAAAEAPLVNTSPYQDSTDAVQILTAHKAKGLEFEYVFVIATNDRAWGNAKVNNNELVLPKNLVSIRHTGVTDDERLRLFFVAITRAKSHLYLTSPIKDFSDKNLARLRYLAEYEQDGEIISPYLPEKSRLVIRHYQDLPADQARSDLKTAWLANYQTIDPDLKTLLLKRLEDYKMTATDLTTFIDIAYAGPRAFYQQKVLRAPDESYSETLTFGNLMHETFEHITSQKLSDAEALEFYEQALKNAAVPDEDLEDLRERGEASLNASLKAFGTLLRDSNARAEVNFNHDHLALVTNSSTPVPLTGKIDHLSINKQDKTIEIYDFKTSAFKDKNWDSHPTLFKYKLQLGFYKLLLNLSPEYSKYKIKKGHILFVVPDSLDGKVYDKVYDFNEKDEILLKSLIQAAYAHVRSLDFLDNPDLFIEPNPQKSVKNIMDFIQLVLDTAPKS